MTICKTFTRKPLIKGNPYRRSDLILNVGGYENMAATYFDPPRDQLYTFFDEDNKEWVNNYDAATGLFSFSLRAGGPMEKIDPWEQTKIRHIFYHRSGSPAGDHEYLGAAIGERHITTGGNDERQFDIL